MTVNPKDFVQIGFIRGAHALKGHVSVHVFSDNEEALSEYGPVYDATGTKTFEFTVTGIKQGDYLCTLPGVTDRNASEALKGTKLFLPNDALPETEEDEFYIKDLIGLTALHADGTTLGKIKNVTDFGAHDALEIEFVHDGHQELASPQTEFILFTKQNVPELNIAAGTLLVDVPEGLFAPAEPDAD
jgi:16S rRNA processing protein RimM